MNWNECYHCITSIKCCFTLFILVVCANHFAECKVFYIAPSNATCPQDQHQYPCLTLSQFAADSDIYIGNGMNISLILCCGNHSFSTKLKLNHLDNVLINKTDEDNSNVIVECTKRSGRFVIKNTTSTTVLIKGIHFIGCSRNKVSYVDNLLLKDTVFQGIEGIITGRVLELHTVTNATVIQVSLNFNSNALGAAILINRSSLTITSSIISNNASNFILCVFKGYFCLTNSGTISNHGIPKSGFTVTNDIIDLESKDCSADVADSTGFWMWLPIVYYWHHFYL